MTLTSLLVFAAALFVAAGSPGPTVAALVARVLTRGARDILPFLAALWIGEGMWLTFAVAGLTAIAEHYQSLFVAIKWIGVAYLLYLSWKMWFAAGSQEDADLPRPQPAWRMFLAGLTVSIGNPKTMMFYIALLPSIIDIRAVTVTDWLVLVGTMFAILIVIDLSWTALASKARQLFLRSPRSVRIVNRISAGTMAGAAAAIAAR